MSLNVNDFPMQVRWHEFAIEWIWKDEKDKTVLYIQKISMSKREDGEPVNFFTIEWPRKKLFTLADFLEAVNCFASAHESRVGGLLTTGELIANGVIFEFDVTSLPLTIDDLENYGDIDLSNLLWMKLICDPPGVSFWFKSSYHIDFSAISIEQLTADEILNLIEQSSDLDPQWVKDAVEKNVMPKIFED